MKCWRQWSKDTGRPWKNHQVSLQIDKQIHFHIVLFPFVGLCDLPTEAREWTGTDFQMSHIVLDSKKKNRGIPDNYPSCAPTLTKKKCTFCFAVELVGKLISLTCCPQRLQSMLLVNRPWKGCWNFHGFGIGWRGAAKQSKKTSQVKYFLLAGYRKCNKLFIVLTATYAGQCFLLNWRNLG